MGPVSFFISWHFKTRGDVRYFRPYAHWQHWPNERYVISEPEDEDRLREFLKQFYIVLLVIGVPVFVAAAYLAKESGWPLIFILLDALVFGIWYFWRIQKLTWHLGMAE